MNKFLIFIVLYSIVAIFGIWWYTPSPVIPMTPEHPDIQTILISNDGRGECDCPIIDIEIDAKTGRGNWSVSYFDPKFKSSSGLLLPEDVKKIVALLKNADFTTWKDKYAIDRVDHPTSNVTITYNVWKTKTISDYGSQGNETLKAIYEIAYKVAR